MKLLEMIKSIFPPIRLDEPKASTANPGGKNYVQLNSNEPHPFHSVEHDHASHDVGACDLNWRD